jgi:hypothetical protein
MPGNLLAGEAQKTRGMVVEDIMLLPGRQKRRVLDTRTARSIAPGQTI